VVSSKFAFYKELHTTQYSTIQKAKYFFWGKYFNFCLFKNPQNSNSTTHHPCFTLVTLPNSLKKDTILVVNLMKLTFVKTLMLILSLKRTNCSIHSPIQTNSPIWMAKTLPLSHIHTTLARTSASITTSIWINLILETKYTIMEWEKVSNLLNSMVALLKKKE